MGATSQPAKIMKTRMVFVVGVVVVIVVVVVVASKTCIVRINTI